MTLLFLFVLLFGPAFAQKVIPLKELRKPETITVDDKHFYIVEMESIYIYSLKDLKLLKKFGKAGEGPQEFKISDASGVRIFVHPEYILVKSLGRVSYFTLDGEYIKEKINVEAGMWVQPLGNRFVGQGRVKENDTVYLTIHFFDSNLKRGKEIFRIKHWFDGKKIDPILHGRFRLVRRGNPIFYVHDNRIFVEGGEDGDVHVFDYNGKKLFHTHYEYEKRKVTEKDKKDVLAFFKLIQSSLLRHEHRFVYPDYFPLLRFFNVADGKVYVLPYKKKNGKFEFHIFDRDGKFKKNAQVPLVDENVFEFYPYTIHGGKMFQVVDNFDTEVWELHITEIE
jgi:hypothetical protein